jgi:pilus assembly protein CpaB
MAAVIAGGATFLISRRLRPTETGPKMISILAASKDLSAGVPLTAEDVMTVGWPEAVPMEGSLKKPEDVVGRPLRVSVSAKQPLLEHYLAAPGSGFGLAGKIPLGMRATAIRSNDVVGVAGFLFPGSHVDVVATYGAISTVGNAQPESRTVLQDVTVLSTGEAVEPDPQGKPRTVNVVTLLLTPEDSQTLLLASQQGAIQFVLRNGTDQDKGLIPPTRLEQLFRGTPRVEQPQPVAAESRPRPARVERPAPPPPPPVIAEAPKPQPHTVEVIQGTQRSTQKF